MRQYLFQELNSTVFTEYFSFYYFITQKILSTGIKPKIYHRHVFRIKNYEQSYSQELTCRVWRVQAQSGRKTAFKDVYCETKCGVWTSSGLKMKHSSPKYVN